MSKPHISSRNDMIMWKLRFSLRKLTVTAFNQRKRKLINKKKQQRKNNMFYNDLTKQTKAHNKCVRVGYKLTQSESYETVLD